MVAPTGEPRGLMFSKISSPIAARSPGRIIKTARRLGIATSRSIRAARTRCMSKWPTRPLRSGRPRQPNPISSSRRSSPLARRSGREAVHPAMAFLSERAAFAPRWRRPARVHRPQPPGHRGDGRPRSNRRNSPMRQKSRRFQAIFGVIESPEHAAKIADEIGYPVMIKARPAAGGKGMRIAHSRLEVAEGFARRNPRRNPRSATIASSSKSSSSTRAISNPSAGRQSTAMSSISASANVRSSAATRR